MAGKTVYLEPLGPGVDDGGWIDPWSSYDSLDLARLLPFHRSFLSPSLSLLLDPHPSARFLSSLATLRGSATLCSSRFLRVPESDVSGTRVYRYFARQRSGLVLYQPVTGPPTSLQPPDENDNDSEDTTTTSTSTILSKLSLRLRP